MNKITLAEYQGRCDEAGTAVGHAPKVLADYTRIAGEAFDVQLFAPRCVLKAAFQKEQPPAKLLPHSIVMKARNSVFEKIANKLRMFANIKLVLKHSEAELVWFFNSEFYLCLYLALFGNGGKKIIFSTFKEDYRAGALGMLKQRIFERAQKRMYVILSAVDAFHFKNARSIFFPDYFCDEEKYAPYRNEEREKKAVCLGTMGAEKQLEEMVEAFTRIGFPLLIAGRFYDKERYEKLKEMAGGNIILRDEYLSAEEYLSLMGSAAFVVLPYSPQQYSTQSSGVMQEALFLDTVVISYKEVLAGNAVPGVALSSWDELKAEDIQEDTSEILKQYASLRRERYSLNYMQSTLRLIYPSVASSL